MTKDESLAKGLRERAQVIETTDIKSALIMRQAANRIEKHSQVLLEPTDEMKEAGFDAGNLGDGEWQYADPERTLRAMAAKALEE